MSSPSLSQRLYHLPILRVTTNPYNFTHHILERSELKSHPARPTQHTIASLLSSFFSALGILFLWLILIHCLRVTILGPSEPISHWDSSPARNSPRPEVVRPSFGYIVYSTRYPGVATPTPSVVFGRPVMTADR